MELGGNRLNNTAIKIKTRETQTPERQARVHPKQKRKKQFQIKLGEKILLFTFTVFLVYAGVKLVSNQVSLYEVNKEIQGLQGEIQEQEKHNNDLYVQVQELSSYERILEKAKEMGFFLNENNVKVIRD